MKRLWASSNAKRSNGFSLIEVIVVISIIAILATIVVIAYSGFGKRTRDSERMSDVAEIKIGLEKYYADNSQYPDACGGSGVCTISALSTPLVSGTKQYMKAIPNDPSYQQNAGAQYQYVRTSSGDGYGIRVIYEEKPTCKTGKRVNASWWGTDVPTC